MIRVAMLAGVLTLAPSLAFAQQDEAVVNRVLGNVPDLVTSLVDEKLPAGTISVQVVDAANAPVPKQPVSLGIMEQSGGRESTACMTDDQGICSFESLAVDAKHSYRVNVPYEGARYSSTPFRLDVSHGQRVRVVVLATTSDDRRVFQILAAR